MNEFETFLRELDKAYNSLNHAVYIATHEGMISNDVLPVLSAAAKNVQVIRQRVENETNLNEDDDTSAWDGVWK